MTTPASSGFDRLRPRTAPTADEPVWTPEVARPAAAAGQGRRALFSVNEPAVPAFGSVSIECSSCQQVSVLGMRRALRLAVPSLYLPVIRGRYPAWLHCPACSAWTWTRVRVRV